MNFFLMHENKKLAVFSVEDNKVVSVRITNNDNLINYLPYTNIENGSLAKRLKIWIENRGIPVTRHNIAKDLDKSKKSIFKYMLDNLGLSLTDHYWFCPCDTKATWEGINLYTNNFLSAYSLDVGDDIESIAGKTNFLPSASLKGDLKKKWMIDSKTGERILVKGNYGISCRQSIAEVLATEIHKRQGKFQYTPYSFIEISSNGQLITGCKCTNFTDINSEFVPAIDIVNSFKKDNSMSFYEAYIQYCAYNGIDVNYMRMFMEYQILTDFIITNTDRHLNNFGVIRDSKTLKFIKPAPIFDSGNSLFYNSDEVKTGYELLDIDVTSFKKKEIKLLEYVTNPYIVDLSLLPTPDEVRLLLNMDTSIKHDILDKVAIAYGNKIELLQELQSGIKIYSYNYLKKHKK